MDLKEILAISGQPGLYKFLAQSARGVIVESLADGKRTNVPPTARVSSMGEIAIFTETEEVPIDEVFRSIYRLTDGKEAIGHKSPQNEIVAFFEQAVPEYDRERVHVSDMKKVIQWYNILVKASLVDLDEPAGERETSAETKEPADEAVAD